MNDKAKKRATPDDAADPASPARRSTSSVVAAQRTIAVLGDVWTLRILRTIFRGKSRFSDFVAEFGVSRAVLTDRLGKLVEQGVLVRNAPDGGHPQYLLSESGLDLWSLFLAMWLWERDWGTARDADTWALDLSRAAVLHTACGQVMRPQLRCTHCQLAVIPQQTAPMPLALPASGIARAVVAPKSASAFRRARAGAAAANSPRLIRVIGDRWNSAVVGAAFRSTRTFARFESELAIGPAQLSERLLVLQDLGILRADVYAGTRQQYRLTEAGMALFPMTLELMRWGNRWLLPPEQALHVRHLPCAERLNAQWHCGHCQQSLARDTIRFT